MNTKDKYASFIRKVLLILFFLTIIYRPAPARANGCTFILTKESKLPAAVQKLKTYNKYTKDWFLFNETFEKCEQICGSEVIVKKGTYTLCRPVYIPSNVTLILEDGVTIRKLTKTGTRKMKATRSMFELVEPSKAYTKGAHSLYNGVHDVNIIGKGNAVIDLDFMEGAIGFVMGHNKRISYDGVTFKHMNTGHFIEMDASMEVSVNNCTFSGSKRSPKLSKEAINIDTPDKNTGGFSHVWTSYDKTPVNNLKITDCTFEETDVAIGTHRYSQQQDNEGNYSINMTHKNIVVQNCSFLKIRKCSFNIMNWDNVLIENCLFDGGEYHSYNPITGETFYTESRAFSAVAATNFIFRNNTLKNMETIGGAYSACTSRCEASNIYTPIKSYFTLEEMDYLRTNQCSNLRYANIYFAPGTYEGCFEDRPFYVTLNQTKNL